MPRAFAMLLPAAAIAAATVIVTPPLRAAEPLFTQTYTVATGAPQTFDAAFPIDLAEDCDGRAVYIVTVASGEGAHGVASGSVALNGVELLAPSDFNNAPQTFERQFVPQASNGVRVRLSGGRPGATLRVTAERRIDEVLLDETFTLSVRSGDFTRSFATPMANAAYVIVVQRAASAPEPKGVSIRVNDVELVNDTLLRREPIVRRTLSLQPQNRLAVSLRGDAGNAIAVSIRRVADESLCAAPLAVTIDSPQTGDQFRQASIIIRGTAQGPRDLGVAVNGTAAQVDLTHAGTSVDPFPWIATVRVAEGAVTLKAVATAPTVRDQAEASVDVWFDPPDGRAELAAFPPSGAPPLDVTFDVTTRFAHSLAKVELDLDGDGVYEQAHSSIPETLSFRYLTHGIREPKVRITDTDGTTAVAAAAVAVESWASVDAIIQERWSAFTSLLEQGKIEDALQLMPGEVQRAKYRPALTAMAAELPQVAPALKTIQPVYLRGDVAHYLLTRTIDGTLRGFRVYFTRGRDGQWKLIQF